MLSKLHDVLKSNFPKERIKLSNIENSFCNSTTAVFYFDRITEAFFKEIKVGNFLCSVDIIHCVESKHELILAELTSFNKYAEKTGKKSDSDCLDYVRNELLDNKVRNKFIHSLFTILKMIDYYNVDKTFYSYLFDSKQLKIKNFLVLDLTAEQYIFIDISCIDKLERHKKDRIEGEISILNCKEFEKRLVV